MKKVLHLELEKAIKDLYNIENREISLEYTDTLIHGHMTTHICMSLAKELKLSPRDIAQSLINYFKNTHTLAYIEKIEMAGPGFLNFFFMTNFIRENISQSIKNNILLQGKTVSFDYTDPNIFKEMHIGHMVANASGESLSRIFEFNGANVIRYSYQSDVGPQIAICIWGMQYVSVSIPDENSSIDIKTKYLGHAYAAGTNTLAKIKEEKGEESDEYKKAYTEIRNINKKLFDKSDIEINKIFDIGKRWSMQDYEDILSILKTKFNHYFFETDTLKYANKIVSDNMHIFRESQGAIIFPGSEHGLHDRVFINSQGLPTYEAKELGLSVLKDNFAIADQNITFSANEQSGHFSVVKKALQTLGGSFKKHGDNMLFIANSLLKLTTGKMSSRTGSIITAREFLNDLKTDILKKIDNNTIADQIAVAAFRYTILRTSFGKDIIYDKEKAISFSGDSGPYLQYTTVRIKSIFEKNNIDMTKVFSYNTDKNISEIEMHICKFNDIMERACLEHAPHLIVNYTTELASLYNNFYTHNKIANDEYNLFLSKKTYEILEKAMWSLGIEVPEKM